MTYASESLVEKRPQFLVQLRAQWSDHWRTVNYLHPVVWFRAAAPSMPTARFTWDAGRLLRSVTAAGTVPGFADFNWFPDPRRRAHDFIYGRLDGAYVRILAVVPGVPGLPGTLRQVWIGVVVASGQDRAGYAVPEIPGLPGVPLLPPAPRGVQTLTAYGLEHLLNLKPIQTAYVVSRQRTPDGKYIIVPSGDGDDVDVVREIQWAPDFNRTYGRGGVRGNQCAPALRGQAFVRVGYNPQQPLSALTAFSDDPTVDPAQTQWGQHPYSRVWSDQTKVQYLLFFHQPAGSAQWSLSGSPPPGFSPIQFHSVTTDRLYGRYAITSQQGKTPWQLLSELASPDLGLGWRVVCADATDPSTQPEVRFFSLVPNDIAALGFTIPGNAEVVDLRVFDRAKVLRAVVEQSSLRRYHRVRAVGERIVSCFTVSPMAGDLAKGWDDALETLYKEGAKIMADGSLNPLYSQFNTEFRVAENERVRGEDRFRHVFARFELPADWQFDSSGGRPQPPDGEEPGDGQTAPHTIDLISSIRGGGEIEFPPAQFAELGRWPHRRRMLKALPLYDQVNYANPFLWQYDAQGLFIWVPGLWPPPPPRAELRRPAVWVNAQMGPGQPRRWIHSENVGGPVTVAPEGDALLVEFTPAHILARNHWHPAEASVIDPDVFLDWQTDLLATVAIELDHRLVAFEDVSGGAFFSGGPERVLDIPVPGAHCWYVAPGTVVGVDSDGELLRVPVSSDPGNPHAPSGVPLARGVVRNDYPTLVNVARVAATWLGLVRSNVVLSVTGSGIPGFSPLGGIDAGNMLRRLDPGSGADTLVNTPVAQIITDNSGDVVVTTLVTGSPEIDPVVVAQRGMGYAGREDAP